MAEQITASWSTVRGTATTVLTTKDGRSGVLQTTYPTEKWSEATFSVKSPEAIAEFRTRVEQLGRDGGEGDYDDEATFADWIQYVFQKRRDVQIML